MKKQENALVVKSNRLIEASYKLDIAEQRLILMAIDSARESGKGITADSLLTVRADEYAAMFELDPKSTYKQLKTAVETIYNRSVRLHDKHPETGEDRVWDVRWVSAVAYVAGSGLVQIQFGAAIVPYITRLEGEFTSYKIKSVAQMTSTYGIRLYELLMQWGDVGRREIKLDEFKQMLQVEGQYPALKDFKKYVLDLAVSQVNDFSDLDVRYENVKLGRKVTGFLFFFGAKKPEPAPPPKAAPKKAKAPEPPKERNISAFAGLEGYAFKALVRDFDFMTEDYVRQMMGKFGLDATATMNRLREDMSPDNFVLEKTD
jgi:plasmid replication initiation protein